MVRMASVQDTLSLYPLPPGKSGLLAEEMFDATAPEGPYIIDIPCQAGNLIDSNAPCINTRDDDEDDTLPSMTPPPLLTGSALATGCSNSPFPDDLSMTECTSATTEHNFDHWPLPEDMGDYYASPPVADGDYGHEEVYAEENLMQEASIHSATSTMTITDDQMFGQAGDGAMDGVEMNHVHEQLDESCVAENDAVETERHDHNQDPEQHYPSPESITPAVKKRRTTTKPKPGSGYVTSALHASMKGRLPRPKQRKRTKKAKETEPPHVDASTKPYACELEKYGCQDRFGEKNEWKRHVLTQHLRPHGWLCDLCDAPRAREKIFPRPDLFEMHVKRMHVPASQKACKADQDAYSREVRTRCFVQLRELPKRSRCGTCVKTFAGTECWNDRMEHIGKHYKDRTQSHPAEDPDLDRYLIDQGLVVPSAGRWILVDNKQPRKPKGSGAARHDQQPTFHAVPEIDADYDSE